MAKTKQQLPLFARFCDKLIPLLARSINQQRESGAEVVMILDTAAGEVVA
jgi:uroporphyrinogen-III decarboxylase